MSALKIETRDLLKVVGRFSEPSILVLGDMILDRYLWGDVERICPEAPVPVVDVKRTSLMLGGAGNVVANLRTFGARVSVLTCIGKDAGGGEVKRLLGDLGVEGDKGLIEDSDRQTTEKTRVVARHQQMVRFDRETRNIISDMTAGKIFQYLEEQWADFDAILISDYGKGMISPALFKRIKRLNERQPKLVTVDPKERNIGLYKKVSLITPNKKEAAYAAGKEIETEEDLKEVGKKIIHELQCENLVITLGGDGMAFFRRDGEFLKIPTFAREVFDVSGAGDTVISTITLALCCGATLPQAIILANYAAGVVVGKVGTASVTSDELRTYIGVEKRHEHSKRTISREIRSEYYL